MIGGHMIRRHMIRRRWRGLGIRGCTRHVQIMVHPLQKGDKGLHLLGGESREQGNVGGLKGVAAGIDPLQALRGDADLVAAVVLVGGGAGDVALALQLLEGCGDGGRTDAHGLGQLLLGGGRFLGLCQLHQHAVLTVVDAQVPDLSIHVGVVAAHDAGKLSHGGHVRGV